LQTEGKKGRVNKIKGIVVPSTYVGKASRSTGGEMGAKKRNGEGGNSGGGGRLSRKKKKKKAPTNWWEKLNRRMRGRMVCRGACIIGICQTFSEQNRKVPLKRNKGQTRRRSKRTHA